VIRLDRLKSILPCLLSRNNKDLPDRQNLELLDAYTMLLLVPGCVNMLASRLELGARRPLCNGGDLGVILLEPSFGPVTESVSACLTCRPAPGYHEETLDPLWV
jgi:hypothetical protein